VRRLLGGFPGGEAPPPAPPPAPQLTDAWGGGGGGGGIVRRRRHARAAPGGEDSSGSGERLPAAAAAARPPLPLPQQQPQQLQQPLQRPPHFALRVVNAINPGLLIRLGMMYFVLGQGATWERQCHIIGALASMYLFGAGFFGWVGGFFSACAVRCCGAGGAGRRATPMGGLTGALLAGRGYLLADLVAALAALLVSAVPGWDPAEELAPQRP
jgi:hypothetical protein